MKVSPGTKRKAFKMTKPVRDMLMLLISLTVLPLSVGCHGDGSGDPVNQPPQGPAGTLAPRAPGGSDQAGGSGPLSGIKLIMTKLAKGPNSLTPVLGKELKEDQPSWETIQGQTKEYARLAAELGKHDPPKGSKESWAKSTTNFAGSAADLNKAAETKNKDAALAAHGLLAKSCMSCHREHRKMGPGMGGPPGGPGGGSPGGFPGRPPGGPPGSPPPQ
jgi:hypothetical protein